MSASNEQQGNNWWAEDDTPVQAHSHVSYRVDARSALLTMCRHFLMAQKYIYVAGWGMTPPIKLVRGKGHLTGPDGSPGKWALLAEFSREGITEAVITFSCSHELTVQYG